jgi:hypothetical protein
MRRGDTVCQTIVLLSVLICTSAGCRQVPPGTADTANQTPNNQASTTPAPVVDKGDLKLRYQTPKSTEASKTHTVGSNPEAIEKVISELNQRLILPFDMDVSFEDCGEPNAYYDPETHQITLCHQLIDVYYELFAKKVKDKTSWIMP